MSATYGAVMFATTRQISTLLNRFSLFDVKDLSQLDEDTNDSAQDE